MCSFRPQPEDNQRTVGRCSSVPRILAATVLAVGAISTVAAQEVRNTIGPLERSAKPSSPENPVPRRIASAQAVVPSEWRQPAIHGSVRLQVTLNTSGRIGEIRRLGEPLLQFAVGTAVDDATRRTMSNAIVSSAAEALRHWAYEPPAAPLTFIVLFTFSAVPDPTSVQQDPPAIPGGALPLPSSPSPSGAASGSRTLANLPPWPAAADAIEIGPGMKPPQVTKSGRPRYTPEALKAKIQGTVMLQIVVGTNGKVRDARVIRSIPMLDEGALAAAREWEFTPTVVDGKPVPVLLTLELDFNVK